MADLWTANLWELISEHFLGWHRITERLPHWPKSAPIYNALTGETHQPHHGPWWWPDIEGEIPPFGCDLPDFSGSFWCLHALLAWPTCKLGGGNGKNRAYVEIASESDVRVRLMVEIEVPYEDATGDSFSSAFRAVARKVLVAEGYITDGGGHG